MAFPPLSNILFIDIETVPQYPDYGSMPDDWKSLWDTKSVSLLKYHEAQTNETLYPRAGIYAEFGKIICISCGALQGAGANRKLVIKSFCGEDERQVLIPFIDMLSKWAQGEQKFLCAHNGKEFDFPYICRRMLVNCISLPPVLNLSGKKSWEIPHLDTLELWKFGDYKHFTSLKLLTKILGVPSPKGDIDGSQVAHVFYVEKDIDRIVTYCEKDTIAVAQIFLRLRREDLLIEDEIIHV